MEIQLKVALVDKYDPKLFTYLRILWLALFIGGMASAYWWPWGCISLVFCYPLAIGMSYFKRYKVTGEIILGYHHITANGERFLIKDMQNINVSIEREPKFSRTPVILTGANNVISFDDHSFRMLLNNNDIDAVDHLVKVWEDTYRLKVGHKV